MLYYDEDRNAYDDLYSEAYEELCEIMSPNDLEFYSILESLIESKMEYTSNTDDESVTPF